MEAMTRLGGFPIWVHIARGGSSGLSWRRRETLLCPNDALSMVPGFKAACSSEVLPIIYPMVYSIVSVYSFGRFCYLDMTYSGSREFGGFSGDR